MFKILLAITALFSAGYSWPPDPEDFRYPRHVHLSLGGVYEMVVTWTTFQPVNSSVEYMLHGDKSWTKTSNATQSLFVDGGSEHRKLFIQRAVMRNLKPGLRYEYHVGSMSGGWSDLFSFIAPRSLRSDYPVSLAVYGDLGNDNPISLGLLQEEAQLGTIDAVLHNGDFAYNMETDNARQGDAFMDQIQPIAGYVPYMTSPGNHEGAYNFSNYRNRFTMPRGDGEGLWYSFDLGPAHIISISTEVYFYISQGIQLIAEQKLWLKQDLQKANANRDKRPWIILQGHRPMYCSNNEHDDCSWFEGIIRYALEDMLYEAGVDILIWAHEHSFERSWPVYNRTVCNGSDEFPYTEPRAPLHLTTGSAGCFARHDPFTPDQPEWSAFRSLNYGYTRMTIYNSTHVHIEQVDAEQKGKVIDDIMVVRHKHGAGSFTCHLG